MRLAHPELESDFIFEESFVNSIVIENPVFFRELVTDIYHQIDYCASGKTVLSIHDSPVEMHKHAEIIDSFASFNINRKSLLSKVNANLEKTAVNESNYMRSVELCSLFEEYLNELSMDMPCSLNMTKINIGSMIRAVGIEIEDDYENDLERLLDYMELVRLLDRDKLFVFVNLRSYYPDEDVELLIETVLSHEYKVILIDAQAKVLLKSEKRVTVDMDLCEF